MASEKIKKILGEEGVREARGELAALFRKILHEIGMTPHKWEYLLNCYLERYNKEQTKTSQERSYARGNLNTQFTDRRMTWRTFMEGMRFLNPKWMRITVELGWTHKTTKHTLSLRMHHIEDELAMMDEPDGTPGEDEAGENALSPPTPSRDGTVAAPAHPSDDPTN